MDPLNMIVRQIHKPNMLIMLDTSGSMTGVPGGTFAPNTEVGMDCDDGQSCRGGFSQGTCVTSGKPCATDEGCQEGTCESGLLACYEDTDCEPIPGSCASGHTCRADSDCPARTDGRCALTGAACSLSTKCTTQYRCRYGSIACASDADCDPGICADGATTCDTSDNCPVAGSGGTCAYGATPGGGCTTAGDCPVRAKVCSNDASITCTSVSDCTGKCTKSNGVCRSNADCPRGATDYCDFMGRTCTSPSNTCLLPRQACSVRYTDNKCENLNTCIGDPNPCTGVSVNRCREGLETDVCNAPKTTTGVRMCREGQTMCNADGDCGVSGDACGPATSRFTIAKRVVRNIVASNANVVNLGLMTFFQAGYYPYYAITETSTAETKAVDVKQGSLRAAGCYSKRAGLSNYCTVNGKTLRLRGSNNAKYLIKGHGSKDVDKYVDANYCGWFCNIPGVGTAIFKGAYYEYEDRKGTPINLTTFPTYQGKTFVKDGVTYRYYDAKADYNMTGTTPPITLANCDVNGDGVTDNVCNESCGGRWDTQLAPFLSTAGTEAAQQEVITHFNQALEPASFGGLIAHGPAPTGCALLNDAAPDRSHSAYHYMQDVKTGDPLQCRLNYVLLVTDGEARGPGDIDCGSEACGDDDPVAAGCNCRAVLAAYSMRKNLNVKTIVVGFSSDASGGAGFLANDNIAKAGGTDLGDDDRSPYAYTAANETGLHQVIQDAIYSVVEGSYATSPSTASQGFQREDKTYSSGSYVLDSRVDFPSWRGHLIAYDVTGTSPVLMWDAAVKMESTDWKQRRVYTSDATNRVIKVDVDPSTGRIRNADVLHGLGLGGNIEEAEKAARWMLGDPALKNPAVLGAIINSTPIDVGPPTDGPMPGQNRYYRGQKDRPPVTYVGSNDGMLHAFFTRTVTADGVTYEGGSEAFAYLPPNMMPMVTKLYAQGGQLADPKQHIYGGLANSPKVKSLCIAHCDDEEAAEWKTLLVVTQGWGGNEVFMLDVTTPLLTPQIYWSSILQGWPEAYDRALGLTVSVPAFTFHKTDGLDDYRLLLASGYKVEEGSSTQGRTFLSVAVRSGTVMDEEVLPGSGWCPQEYTLIADVATSRKQFTNADGKLDGRKEFLTAYVGDTWGKLWRYGPDAELIMDFGCDNPLYFSPTVVQLNADDPTNPLGGDSYLVQVTNAALDDDTSGFGHSKMILVKETNSSGRPQLDTTYGVGGTIRLSTENPQELCGITDSTGTSCLRRLPQEARPLSTPMAVVKVDGTGFYILSNWYVPDTTTCSKGVSYFMIHDVSGGVPTLKQAFKIGDEPVLSSVVVGGKLIISSSQGPVQMDGAVTTTIVDARPADTLIGELFEMGGWSEIQ